MNFLLSIPLMPLFSTLGHVSAKTGLSPVLSLLLLDLVTAVWICPQFSLLTSTITWGVVWVACAQAPMGRFSGTAERKQTGHEVGVCGGNVMLAGCLLLVGVCERASGVQSHWVKAIIPAAVYFIRAPGRGDDSPVRGARRVLFLVTVAATIALRPGFVSSSALALGCCSAVFTAVALVLLERSLAEPTVAGALTNSIPGRAAWEEDETWRSWTVVGREVGTYLFFGFAGASLVFENFPFQLWAKTGVYEQRAPAPANTAWVGMKLLVLALLGAAKWAVVPFVINRYSVVTVGFMDLAIALPLGVPSMFSRMQLLGAAVAFVGMSTCIPTQSGVDHPGGLPNVRFRARPTRLCIILTPLVLVLGTYTFSSYHHKSGSAPPSLAIATASHPIPKLVQRAEARYSAMRTQQSQSLPEAIAEYQRRYRMNPPPNFDRWYEFARSHNVVLIDEYDMIYHSLKPFWGLPPAEIRKKVREAIGFHDPVGLSDNGLLHVAIRNGGVNIGGQGLVWQKDATRGMIERFAAFLPEMDLAFNTHDEPRVVVPNDMLNQYLARAEKTLASLSRDNTVAKNEFTPLLHAERAPVPDFPRTQFNKFPHQPSWNSARLSCPADSPAKSVDEIPEDAVDRFSVQPLGFIINVTESSNICLSPSLAQRHGFFDRPNVFNVAQSLIPIFSQSKVSSFNDILYPSPWYWADMVQYNETKDIKWERKTGTLYWRGSTTGGYSRNGGWKYQHRQRLVGALNANDTAKVLAQDPPGNGNWSVQEERRAGLAHLFDVRFSSVGQCDPNDCAAQRGFFNIAPVVDRSEAWLAKYLLDVDGNAFSGRYYAFLESRSAVLKQAVFREWHEEWIVPWVHYVPVSMEMEEVAEVIRFFETEEEGKLMVRRIADEGRDWARRVLRKADLEAWLFRLLLEYGRVIDDNRETIGFHE